MNNNYIGLLSILLPLFIGYFIPLAKRPLLRRRQHQLISLLLQWIVYGLLLVMGMQLALLDELRQQISHILSTYLLLFISIISCNCLLLLLVDRYFPLISASQQPSLQSTSILQPFFTLVVLIFVVVAGYWLGSLFALPGSDLSAMSQGLLLFMLLLVGIELGNSQLSLRSLLLNRHALLITLIVALSSLTGGLLTGYCLNLPAKTALALSSSYGWYTLSSVVLSNAINPLFGAIAFLNDLSRELLAIVLIPFIARKYSATALGICGATALDITLPLLKKSAGQHIVPVAIIQGFILTLLTPILLTFWLG